MSKSLPWILEGSLSVDARLLVFADSITSAADQLEAKMPELQEYLEQRLQGLALNAMMNPNEENKYLLFYFDVRPAEGREVAGTEALKPDEITLDACEHDDHEHDYEED